MIILLRMISLTLLGLSLSGCFQMEGPEAIPKLRVVKVLPVDSDFPVEPSGMVMHAGVLYVVCDKTDDRIFRVEIGEDRARLWRHLGFSPPARSMDYEGVTIDAQGNFYLISEYHHRILRVEPSGRAEWFGPNFKTHAEPEGMLRRFNAGLEGITLLDDGSFLLAAEREERGLMRWHPEDGDESPPRAMQAMPQTRFSSALAFWRIPDFAGLARDGDRLFALFRNAHLVVELEPDGDLFTESERAWSYAHVENDPRYAYVEERFGQAEGIAVSGNRVYLILDNNQGPRLADSEDIRPQLFILEFP